MKRPRLDRSDGELFAELYPALRRFAGAVRPVGADADDLVQEALARTLALRSLDSLDEPLAYLRTAVLRIAMNITRGRRRHDARVAKVARNEQQNVDAYPSDLNDLWSVPVDARAVLFLTVIDGLSYREAAAAVGCSEVAARQMAARALHRLRAEISSEERTGDMT